MQVKWHGSYPKRTIKETFLSPPRRPAEPRWPVHGPDPPGGVPLLLPRGRPGGPGLRLGRQRLPQPLPAQGQDLRAEGHSRTKEALPEHKVTSHNVFQLGNGVILSLLKVLRRRLPGGEGRQDGVRVGRPVLQERVPDEEGQLRVGVTSSEFLRLFLMGLFPFQPPHVRGPDRQLPVPVQVRLLRVRPGLPLRLRPRLRHRRQDLLQPVLHGDGELQVKRKLFLLLKIRSRLLMAPITWSREKRKCGEKSLLYSALLVCKKNWDLRELIEFKARKKL